MGSRRYHLGTGFEVWTGQQSWFWFVDNPRRNGGTVGAAANEAEAVRQARLSIEEMSAQLAQPRETSEATGFFACSDALRCRIVTKSAHTRQFLREPF